MSWFLQLLAAAWLVPVSLACGYYVFLAAVALLPRKGGARAGAPRHTFAILIPAHNEEGGLAATLRSCHALDYPRDRYRVFVIADNCDDCTADVARAEGAICLERRDHHQRGKGPALAWGLGHVLREAADAVVVLDADCRLDAHALRSFDAHLAAGHRALQANDVAANPDDSGTSYAVAVGNLIENDLFYAPKSRLGGAVFLRGTGMVFAREILERFPWQAHSVAEDVEYTLGLLWAGERVRFVPEVRVASAFPADSAQLAVQRTRWAAGNLWLTKAEGLGLLLTGLLHRRPLLVDAGWTLLVLSRPLVLLNLFASCLLTALCTWFAPSAFSRGLAWACLLLVGLFGLYFGLGVLRLGLSRRRVLLLARAFTTVLRLVAVTCRGAWAGRKLAWVQTPRTSA
jgi:1,2-diacylglycerol 3-beta-glucosyltransferase